MNALFKKIIFLYLFLLVNISVAQHEHNVNIYNPENIQFSFKNSDFAAEVASDVIKFTSKKKMILYLKLSSDYSIDTSSVSLKIKSDNGKNEHINKLMNYSSGYYKSTILLKENGTYQFVFGFDFKDSSGNLKKTNFSFNKDIEDADSKNNHDHGFMGMSGSMMIIMGAAMLAMMTIALILGAGHK